MNPNMKRIFLPAALALALCPWQPAARAAAAPDNPAQLFPDPVIGTGKGFEIKSSQLDEAFVSANASAAVNGGSIPEERRAEVRSNLLDHLIITKILSQKATPEDQSTTRKLVDDNIDQARKSAPTPEIFDEQIKASGMTLAEVRERAYS